MVTNDMHSNAMVIDTKRVRRSNKMEALERERERKPFMRDMSLRNMPGGFCTNPASSRTVWYTRKYLEMNSE